MFEFVLEILVTFIGYSGADGPSVLTKKSLCWIVIPVNIVVVLGFVFMELSLKQKLWLVGIPNLFFGVTYSILFCVYRYSKFKE